MNKQARDGSEVATPKLSLVFVTRILFDPNITGKGSGLDDIFGLSQ